MACKDLLGVVVLANVFVYDANTICIYSTKLVATIDDAMYHVGQADSIFRSTEFDGSGESSLF